MTTIQGAASHALHHGNLQGPASTNPTHASTTMQGGKAVFENDNYRISAGDDNTINVQNKHTGESYQVWGDPHVNVDGQHAFDFWGTTTFTLEDETKITIDTVPAGNNMTLASKMTITNGDYGVQVSGIDTNKCGDLKIDEAKGWGSLLDAAVDDGNVLQENPAGKGFLGIDEGGQIRAVDQNYINHTDLQKGGKSQDNPLFQRLFQAFENMSGLISAHFHGSFLNQGGERQEGHVHRGEGRPHHHHCHHGHRPPVQPQPMPLPKPPMLVPLPVPVPVLPHLPGLPRLF
jgi:hypothetical protein